MKSLLAKSVAVALITVGCSCASAKTTTISWDSYGADGHKIYGCKDRKCESPMLIASIGPEKQYSTKKYYPCYGVTSIIADTETNKSIICR